MSAILVSTDLITKNTKFQTFIVVLLKKYGPCWRIRQVLLLEYHSPQSGLAQYVIAEVRSLMIIGSTHLFFMIILNFHSIPIQLNGICIEIDLKSNRNWTEIEQKFDYKQDKTDLSLYVLNFHSISAQILINYCSISVPFSFNFCSVSVQFSMENKQDRIEKSDELTHW